MAVDSNPEIIGALIRDENEMINHRMNWFLILQGFLFASIAFAWDKGISLSIVFSCVGILSSLSVGVLLRYGILAIKNLEESCGNHKQPIIGRGYKVTPRIIHLFLPWHFLPYLFAAAWLALILIRVSGFD